MLLVTLVLTAVQDVTLSVTVADDSHNHVIANIDGLANCIKDGLN